MHSVFYGQAPSYISEVVTAVTHLPGRAHLRSAKNGDYDISRVLSGFGQRSFSVSGPDAWNSLPRQLRGIAVASTFNRHLKSELFFSSLRRFDDCFNRCWSLRLFALLIDVFFIDNMCVFFILACFSVISSVFLKIQFWYLRCCGCPWNRGRQHLATPLKTCYNTEAGFLQGGCSAYPPTQRWRHLRLRRSRTWAVCLPLSPQKGDQRGMLTFIYLHCQAPPSTFCRGRYRNVVDWLIDWYYSKEKLLFGGGEPRLHY